MDLLDANDEPGKYPRSYYAAHATPLELQEEAAGELNCDVCIIGAGFTGLSSAMHLAQRGYDVIVLDARRIGFGASGRNGGQVSSGQRLDPEDLEKLLGIEHAKALFKLGCDAVKKVRDLSQEALFDCEYVPGIVHCNHRQRYDSHSREYAQKLQDHYGYQDIRFLNREEVRQLVASPAYHGGTLDMGSGHIDPLEFCFGLARKAMGLGARIFEQSRVTGFETGAKPVVRTDKAVIKCGHVILACNGYLGSLDDRVAARVMPINNYIIATEPMSKDTQEALIRNNYAVVDSKFVVNYFRFSPDRRLLFGGTETYGYRFPKDIAARVSKPLFQIFPQLKDKVRIDYAWGGTLGITMNRMPHFERLSPTAFSMSGYSGQGVALGTLAGEIAADLISGQAERFDLMASVPTPRFPGGVMMRYPLLVMAMLWFSLRDRL